MKKGTIRAQRREQWEKVKQRPLRERLAYLALYYRVEALLLVAAVLGVGSMVYHFVTAKETFLCVSFVDVNMKKGVNMEEVRKDFLSFADLDPQKYDISWEGTLTTDFYGDNAMAAVEIQKLAALVNAGEIDVMIVTDTWIRNNRDTGMFADLSEVLPKELLESCREQIFYLNSTVDDKGEFPVGISVSRSPLMLSPDLPAYFCVASTSRHTERAADFLHYLLGK